MGSNESNVGQSTKEAKPVPSADKSVDSSSKDRAEATRKGTKPKSARLVGPDNTLSVVGQSVKLNCSALSGSSKIQWSVLVNGTRTRVLLVKNCKVDPRVSADYDVDKTDNACNLVINSTSLHSAGTYTCIDRSVRPLAASANLVVLESEPTCKSTAEGQKLLKAGTGVNLTCSVRYAGAIHPSMVWTDEFGKVVPSRIMLGANKVQSCIDLKVKAPTLRPYTCKTSFNLMPLAFKNSKGARKAPGYVYSWTSKPVAVKP